MKKSAATLLILMLVGLTGLVNAQTNRIKAQVPFDFVVNGKTMPAGECTIEVTGIDRHVLWIASGDEHLFVLPLASESLNSSSKTSLVFHRYGDRYFLENINREGATRGYQLPASKLEGELRARNTAEQILTLLASAE